MPILTLEETAKKDWEILGLRDDETHRDKLASKFVKEKGSVKSAYFSPIFNDKSIVLSGLDFDYLPAPYYDAGDCDVMTRAHVSTFLNKNKEYWGNAVLFFYGNGLIGSMKFHHDRSLLGLRNINDSNGWTLFSMGMVYSVSLELKYAARDLMYVKHNQKFPALDIKPLLGTSNFEIYPIAKLNFDYIERPDFMKRKRFHDELVSMRDKLEAKHKPSK